MAISGLDPAPLEAAQTERVRGGRRAAIAVAVVAVLVVGLFIWKPWDAGAPRATPRASLPVAAAEPSQPAVATQAPASLSPAATGTPVAAPSVDTGEDRIPAPRNLGFVSLPPDDRGTFVYCVYGRAATTGKGLVTMVVNPPLVITGPAARDLVRTITFRPEVEVNSLEDVFSADWNALNHGRLERARLDPSLVSLFKSQQVKVNVGNLPTSAVLRVAITINWIGMDGEQIADMRVYPAAYAPLGDASSAPIPEGCPAHN